MRCEHLRKGRILMKTTRRAKRAGEFLRFGPRRKGRILKKLTQRAKRAGEICVLDLAAKAKSVGKLCERGSSKAMWFSGEGEEEVGGTTGDYLGNSQKLPLPPPCKSKIQRTQAPGAGSYADRGRTLLRQRGEGIANGSAQAPGTSLRPSRGIDWGGLRLSPQLETVAST